MENAIHDDNAFPVPWGPYNVHRSLLVRVSPFWWEVPTHCSYSRSVSLAETGSQFRQYPSRTSRTASCMRRIHNILFGITILTLSSVITFHITQLPDAYAVSSEEYTITLCIHIKHVCSLPSDTSNCLVPPVTTGDRHQSGGSYLQRSREVAMTTSDHLYVAHKYITPTPISTISEYIYRSI